MTGLYRGCGVNTVLLTHRRTETRAEGRMSSHGEREDHRRAGEEKRRRVISNHSDSDLSHNFRRHSAALLGHGDGTVVVWFGHLALREQLFLFNPAMRLLEYLPRIRLEYQTLSRPKPADIDQVVILFRQLF